MKTYSPTTCPCTYIRLDLAKHIVPVVPDTVKPQHIPIKLKELPQFVISGRSGVAVLRLATRLHVRVCGLKLWVIQVNTLTLHELLQIREIHAIV